MALNTNAVKRINCIKRLVSFMWKIWNDIYWDWTDLLSYQLGVYAGFPRRGSLADVTHEALKCFRCIPISADTTIPIIFFQNLRLAFSASRMVHCSSKSIVELCTFSKESFPSFEAPSASLNFTIFWTPDIFQQNVTKDMQ